MSQEEMLGSIKADLVWMKEFMEKADKKYAAKWVERIQWLMVIGVLAWAGNQLLGLIGTAKAMF